MLLVMARNWWVLIVRGLIAIALGIVTFVWPGITLGALVLLFGAYAFIDGAMSITGAVRATLAHERWASLLLEGVAGIAGGAVAFLWPGITIVALVFVIAAWAIVTGAFEIAAAWRLRRHVAGEWLLALSGVASVVFGVLVTLAPITGALVLALWFGAYVFVSGLLLIGLGFRLRGRTARSSFASAVQQPSH
jgi:uncharacterized membrane protein HdeD (DUF308 family)